MNETVASILISLITALATGVISSFLYWRKIKAELQKEYASHLNERKWKVYTSLMNWYLGQANFYESDSHSIDIYQKHMAELILVGSDKVLKAHKKLFSQMGTFHDNAHITDQELELNFKFVTDLLLEIRRDLGFKTNISRDDLSSVFYYKDEMLGE